jgi:hypothetical protein
MSRNTRKSLFLTQINQSLLQDELGVLQHKISFNFHFFDHSQEHASAFSDLTHEQLIKFCEKLRQYTKESIEHWKRERIGSRSGRVIEVYGGFPTHSEFQCPTHVPANIEWARFRLESDFRLVGFIINEKHAAELMISKNTFYVVFIDQKHKFYPMNR